MTKVGDIIPWPAIVAERPWRHFWKSRYLWAKVPSLVVEVDQFGRPMTTIPAPPTCDEDRLLEIADQAVPEYRGGKRAYSCCGVYAKRWQAAYDAARIALYGSGGL